MIKIYRKTDTIKAEQFNPANGVIPEGVFDKDFEYTTRDMIAQMMNNISTGVPVHNWHVKTLEGDLEVKPGDWVATGVNGEHWAIKNDVFKKTYAELPVIPEMVSKYIEVVQGEVALYDAMDTVLAGFGTLPDWMSNNQDLFARAWLDGYTVEEDSDAN
ncbi:DUF1642 domain-containing protein [Lactiplantibacillus plantarum]|uniref:DUF1642 domain-containing protein n=1 Tax=Lactiplantibacillus plantarum TaxID=1590 RepID=UPI00264FC349|nr:DUF1642 domain-containing protein [Lactiplantibacillus plantarum]MDN7060894.1 DUF1642 domain-containing protein [Lactiplantibacillus plantarum]